LSEQEQQTCDSKYGTQSSQSSSVSGDKGNYIGQVVTIGQNKWEDTPHTTYNRGISWHDSVRYCSNLVLDGIDDWRIPTVDELLSIADRNNYPKIVDGFEYVQPGPYWTSNPKNDTDAYIVDFHSGLESGYVNKNQYGGLYIRCISNGDGAGSSQSSSSEQASSSSVGQQEECLYSNVQIATEIKYGTYNEAVEYCQSQGLMLPDLDQMNIVYESLDRVHPENADRFMDKYLC
jgi:hypothetical protein